MLSGIPPFKGHNNEEIFRNIKKGEYDLSIKAFRKISDLGKDLLKKILVKDFRKRPTAEECFEHPWFKEVVEGGGGGEVDEEAIKNFRGFQVRFFFFRLFYHFLIIFFSFGN